MTSRRFKLEWMGNSIGRRSQESKILASGNINTTLQVMRTIQSSHGLHSRRTAAVGYRRIPASDVMMDSRYPVYSCVPKRLGHLGRHPIASVSLLCKTSPQDRYCQHQPRSRIQRWPCVSPQSEFQPSFGEGLNGSVYIRHQITIACMNCCLCESVAFSRQHFRRGMHPSRHVFTQGPTAEKVFFAK